MDATRWPTFHTDSRACCAGQGHTEYTHGLWYNSPVDIARCKTLLSDLEQSPRRVQLHHGELSAMISDCMDEVFELSKSVEDNTRKMQLVGVEYRARLLLDRWKQRSRN